MKQVQPLSIFVKRILGALAVLSALNFIPAEAHPHKSITGRKGHEKITTGIIKFYSGFGGSSQQIKAKNVAECKRVLNKMKRSFLDDANPDDDMKVWFNCVNIAID